MDIQELSFLISFNLIQTPACSLIELDNIILSSFSAQKTINYQYNKLPYIQKAKLSNFKIFTNLRSMEESGTYFCSLKIRQETLEMIVSMKKYKQQKKKIYKLMMIFCF